MRDWYSFLTRMIIEQFPSSYLTSAEPTVSVYDLLQSYEDIPKWESLSAHLTWKLH